MSVQHNEVEPEGEGIRLQRRVRSLEREVRRLSELAFRDPLTGLFNRHGLLTSIRETLEAGERSGLATGLIVLDLDDFKALNDREGHLAGDSVLRAVGQALLGGLPANSRSYRFGGDEFVVLCAECDPRRVRDIAMSVEVLVSRCGSNGSKVRSTTGWAVHDGPCEARSPLALFEAADRDLLWRKGMRHGRPPEGAAEASA